MPSKLLLAFARTVVLVSGLVGTATIFFLFFLGFHVFGNGTSSSATGGV
jgi:hypothetical protein